MSLIVCLRGKDGMVLASDSRGTFGDPRGVTAQNDNQKKVYRLSKYVGCAVAGSGEIGARLMDELIETIQQKNVEGTNQVVGVVREVVKKRYDEWFAKFVIQPITGAQQPVRPDLVLILGGYDYEERVSGKQRIPMTGNQRIYQMVSGFDFAPMLHDYGFALNGVAQYALYLLNRLYVPDSPIARLLPLAAYVITETASQDGKVGGPVQITTVKPAVGCMELPASEVEKILAENRTRSEALRESFFGDRPS